MRRFEFVGILGLVFLTPIANAAPQQEAACQIIEASINFRFTQEDGLGACGTDSFSDTKLCLRKSSDSLFVSSEKYELKPAPQSLTAPKFVPSIKLDKAMKEKIRTAFREVSMSRGVLRSRDRKERAKTEDSPFSNFLTSGIENENYLSAVYEREIKRMTRAFGPYDPKVIKLEENYISHKEKHKEALSKTTPVLRTEVSYTDQLNYDILHAELTKHAGVYEEIKQALNHWDDLSWLNSIDCSNKIKPHNAMLVRREKDYIVVQTGKSIERLYTQHPKTFYPRSLAVNSNGTYAFIRVSGHGGGSSYSIGRKLPTYLLKNTNEGWSVIASSDVTPVFH